MLEKIFGKKEKADFIEPSDTRATIHAQEESMLERTIIAFETVRSNFLRRFEELDQVAKLLKDNPLAEQEYAAITRRIDELREFWKTELSQMQTETELHMGRLKETLGILDEPDDAEDAADDEILLDEDFGDLHGIAPGTIPEDIPDVSDGDDMDSESDDVVDDEDDDDDVG